MRTLMSMKLKSLLSDAPGAEVPGKRGASAAGVVGKLWAIAPYAVMELILPGGSLMALLLWWYRRQKKPPGFLVSLNTLL
jgi:hypothetical protein